MTLYIKNWFYNKMKSEGTFYGLELMNGAGGEVVKETEKAVMIQIEAVRLDGEDVLKTVWVPKSCTMNDEEAIAEAIKNSKRFENAENEYNEMIDFAKSNKVVARKGMKKETILKNIYAAGLTYKVALTHR